MALHALQIVSEEVEAAKKCSAENPFATSQSLAIVALVLTRLQTSIIDRIETECLELPGVNGDEPDVDIQKDDVPDEPARKEVRGEGYSDWSSDAHHPIKE